MTVNNIIECPRIHYFWVNMWFLFKFMFLKISLHIRSSLLLWISLNFAIRKEEMEEEMSEKDFF